MPVDPAARLTDPRAALVSADPAAGDARLALLRDGEAALARGEVAPAIERFDRAAAMLHSPDTEMALVRATMQAGNYRQALAFCAHTAGGHLESGDAGALYAWLLRAGGQPRAAANVLSETLARLPGDATALAAQAAMAADLPVATGLLLEPPQRLAPYAWPAGGAGAEDPPPPRRSRVVATGVLTADGLRAVVPSAGLPATGQGAIWVRNGLGQTVRARIEPPQGSLPDKSGVTLLRLDSALPVIDREPATAAREPFAGSPGFIAAYAASTSSSGEAAWPWLVAGFFGAFPANGGLRRLGVAAPAGSSGAPVLDATGRVVGMVVGDEGQGDAHVWPESAWHPKSEATPGRLESQPPKRAIPVDEAYERALRVALQVIVAD